MLVRVSMVNPDTPGSVGHELGRYCSQVDLVSVSGRIITRDAVVAGEVICHEGVIVEIRPATGSAVADQWVCPGFIDLQINGSHGIDLVTQPRRMGELSRWLPAEGTTAFLPTVITSSPATRSGALEHLSAASMTTVPGRGHAHALGVHLEGPLLSPVRVGAHPPEHLASVTQGVAEQWTRERGVAMVTLAPEIDGAIELIRALVASGIVVSLGHTNATAAEFQGGIEAGARYVTHLFNAMRPFSHRDPGPIGAVLADGSITAGLICDGIHVDPVAIKMAWRSMGPERITLVTDAVAARGTGAFPRGVRTASGVLAGSALFLDQALRLLIEITGADLIDAVRTVTTTPAAILGVEDRGEIRVGARADLTVLDAQHRVRRTYVGGVSLVSDARSALR
jgi:N-acetylglucosamine-6-phosphate deacetylase